VLSTEWPSSIRQCRRSNEPQKQAQRANIKKGTIPYGVAQQQIGKPKGPRTKEYSDLFTHWQGKGFWQTVYGQFKAFL